MRASITEMRTLEGPINSSASGPGGGIYSGPPTEDGYKGPWSPCITGIKGKKWMKENCPL